MVGNFSGTLIKVTPMSASCVTVQLSARISIPENSNCLRNDWAWPNCQWVAELSVLGLSVFNAILQYYYYIVNSNSNECAKLILHFNNAFLLLFSLFLSDQLMGSQVL